MDGLQWDMCSVVWCVTHFQLWDTELIPGKHVACADNTVDRSVTLGLTCAPHEASCVAAAYSVAACLCCLWALPLGCWTHCHSNCCRADLSCTSLKLIASHSIHFTNMCSNYYFAKVIIKRETIENKRGEMANIPGVDISALIMTETDWPSFGGLCPDSVIWKEETIRPLLAALNLPNKHAYPDESVIKHMINMETAFSLGLAKYLQNHTSSSYKLKPHTDANCKEMFTTDRNIL